LDKLFINFSSLSEHVKSNQRGTGLGLSICKQIIQKMGGTVSVKSKEGVGSTFKIEISTLCKNFDGSELS
jgi:signal transduction histidine kinase